MERKALIEAFQAGEIDGSVFRHEDHVRMARGLAERYGHDEGLRRMIAPRSRASKSPWKGPLIEPPAK